MGVAQKAMASAQVVEVGPGGRARGAQPRFDVHTGGRGSYAGLCLGCSNAAMCTFPRTAWTPVTACDEFADGVAPVTRTAPTGPFQAGRCGAPGRDITGPAEMGLCSTCDLKRGCTFRDGRRAVRQCEEYL